MADRLYSERLMGFCDGQTDGQTDRRTDICDSRVAFATEKAAHYFNVAGSSVSPKVLGSNGPRYLKVIFKYELDSKEGSSCLPFL